MSQVTLQKALTREWLQTNASPLSYERGLCYWREDRVQVTSKTETGVIAAIQGTDWYEVKFWMRGKTLCYYCTCPFAREGSFCKHGVALGLTLLEKFASPLPTLRDE